MNGAEFKTIREACGLSVPDMAKLAISPRTGEPVGERTVRYWESGTVPVPDDVAQLLEQLDAKLTQEAGDISTATSQTVTHIVRYRENEDLWHFRPDMKGMPATCHAALINRARLALQMSGRTTRIIWMEPGEYRKWLAGRKDSEALRAAWAAERY
jgi:hypothetical protein